MTATRSTNQREQSPLKMPLSRLGWTRSDWAPYGDSDTLGPFCCIGLSVGMSVLYVYCHCVVTTNLLVKFDVKSTLLEFKFVYF
jgi:hypothetical protein